MKTEESSWNKTNGVARTLIGNYVEERNTADYVLAERKQSPKSLNVSGHAHILTMVTGRELSTTTGDSYRRNEQVESQIKETQGRLEKYLEAEWMKQINREIDAEEEQEQQSIPDFTSFHTTSQDAQSIITGLYPNIQYLGKTPSTVPEKGYPITFWSENAREGATSKEKTGFFGKHTNFSTPVKEYTKAQQKE